MKLFYHVMIRLSLGIILVLAGWAVCFYYVMVDEINDEIDDSLEDYSELVIIRMLAGEELPSNDSGSNNQYYLSAISKAEAMSMPSISLRDSMVYIAEKGEEEPARILTSVFCDDKGEYFKVTVSTPTIEKKDLIEAILHQLLALFVFLLLAILLINVWVFRKSMKPLYVLLHWLDNNRLGGKNTTPLNNPTDVTEFCKLNDAVVRYAEHSQSVYEQQKMFIGNASHETQTPLAICQNRIEMLMEDEGLEERHLEELAKTLGTIEYVTRLNKTLLLLSKIDNNQYAETAEVVINDIVDKYVGDYSEVYANRGVKVEVNGRSPMKVEMNEMLATVLVTNLMKNAFVHNIDGGRVEICIDGGMLEVRNTGVDKALDASRIFERFYQGNKKKEGSTGLGLAIVHSICQQSGLSVNYEFRGEMHCFKVVAG